MTRYRNLLLFTFLAAVWGSSFMAINAGLADFPPVLFAAARYDIAAVAMLAYAWYVVDDPIPRGWGEWGLVVIGSVLLIGGYNALVFVGQSDPTVTSAAAAVIISLSPVLTTGFARLLLPDERLTLLGVAGLLFGLVGVVVLAQPDPDNLLAGGFVARILLLGAAGCFALGSVLTRRSEVDMPMESMEAWSMVGGALLLHVVSLGVGESISDVRWTPEGIASLLFLAIVAGALGYLIYLDLIERLGAIEINLVTYVAPVFAALAGWIALKEAVELATVTGFLLIFIGFLLIKRKAIRAELRRIQHRPEVGSD
ncbi:MAG: DMT family transporter [Halobacteriota archaeon]